METVPSDLAVGLTLCKLLNFVVSCLSSNRKLIQKLIIIKKLKQIAHREYLTLRGWTWNSKYQWEDGAGEE